MQFLTLLQKHRYFTAHFQRFIGTVYIYAKLLSHLRNKYIGIIYLFTFRHRQFALNNDYRPNMNRYKIYTLLNYQYKYPRIHLDNTSRCVSCSGRSSWLLCSNCGNTRYIHSVLCALFSVRLVLEQRQLLSQSVPWVFPLYYGKTQKILPIK